jgi:hypothetical protein
MAEKEQQAQGQNMNKNCWNWKKALLQNSQNIINKEFLKQSHMKCLYFGLTQLNQLIQLLVSLELIRGQRQGMR